MCCDYATLIAESQEKGSYVGSAWLSMFIEKLKGDENVYYY